MITEFEKRYNPQIFKSTKLSTSAILQTTSRPINIYIPMRTKTPVNYMNILYQIILFLNDYIFGSRLTFLFYNNLIYCGWVKRHRLDEI